MKLLTLETCKNYLSVRGRESHKGDFGHVLVVGGDYGYGGACRLAGEAALRTGAGLVSIATRPQFAFAITGACPELMCWGIESTEDLDPLLERATVVAVGSGLGQHAWGQTLLEKILLSPLPLVVDADALNLLSLKPQTRENWILTPHPGEAARLLQSTVTGIQQDRIISLKTLQERYHGVVILKGNDTVISDGIDVPSVCRAGNPGMATAGMGDVLTGIVAALVAQQLSLLEAAKLGVMAHASAGDLAATKIGERGIIARDLLDNLQGFLN